MAPVEGSPDPRTGLPVFSLYGRDAASLEPSSEALRGLDLLVHDVQDVGCRYYTFSFTLLLAMRACARAGVEVLVLDRPNPLGGVAIEGGGISKGYESFVGIASVPARHGLTVGELGRLLAPSFAPGVRLSVASMVGWRRAATFEETGLPWVQPSPNMPTVDTARVYPGMCLLEGTNLSEGRGTTRPFEIFGAPFIDGERLAAALAREDLPGVRFRPLRFRPTFHKFSGETCGGLQLHVVDTRSFRPLRTGVAVLRAVRALWPDRFAWRTEPYEFVSDRLAIDLLAGGPALRQAIEANAPLSDIVASWRVDEDAFREARAGALLYAHA